MMSTNGTRAAAAALILALSAAFASAQAAGLSAESRVDWESRVLRLRVELDAAAAGLRLPSGRLEAERLIEREFAGLAKEAVFGLPVDSYRTVSGTVAEGSLDVNGLLGIAAQASHGPSSFSRDMRFFSAEYSIPLGAVAALYAGGTEAVPLAAPLEHRPSRPYTGIVIYAESELPVHGERVSASLRPCLFPRIFDEDMRPVMKRDNVEPAVLAAWGPLGYAAGLLASAEDRVGDDPLRIRALGVFGAARTDIVISREDAARILSRPENRDLLRLGRVLVVLDLGR